MLRNGNVISIQTSDIVVGDIVNFNIGDIFSVDGILISGSEVKTDESSMTGETD